MPPERLIEEFGWALVPVDPATKSSHHAVMKAVYGSARWKPLREDKATTADVEEWRGAAGAKRVPLEFGVITGAPSGVTVLDVDEPELADFRCPSTAVVRTPRPGYHVYLEGTAPTTRHAWGHVKSAGSLVVLPNGVDRHWMVRPDELALADLSEFVDNSPTTVLRTTRRGQHKGDLRVVQPARNGVWASDENLEAALRFLGIPAGIGEEFICVIPGHATHRPHAKVDPLSGRYHCFDKSVTQYWSSLAEIFYLRRVGVFKELRGVPGAVWRHRLEHESGIVPVEAAPLWLPREAGSIHIMVAEGFALLWALEQHHRPCKSVPYSARFAAEWCGIGLKHFRRVSEALRDLTGWETILPAGDMESGYGKRTRRYVPGRLA